MNKHGEQLQILKKVFQYLGLYRIFLVFTIVLAGISVALTLYIPKLTGKAIDVIVSAGHVDFPVMTRILIQIGVCMICTGFCQWLMSVCSNKMTYQIIRDVRNDAFAKLEILPLSYMDAHPQGEIVSRVIADVDQFADGLLMGFTQLFTGVATIAGTLLFMLSVNVKITLVAVLITPISFVVAGFIAKKTFSMFQLQAKTRAEQTALIDEMIGDQKVVQAYGQEKNVLDKFCEMNERLGSCSLKAIFFSSITNPATRFVNSLVYAGVGITGALAAIRGTLSVGQLTCFLSYANQYTKPFNEISGVVTELQNAIACAGRIFALMEEKAEKPDAAHAVVLDSIEGKVDIKEVSFSYVPDQKLIRNLNLEVKPGQKIAIVGQTGCGKTTLINLLMRFYDVNEGSISVDQTDIQDITRKSLRSGFGMVLQETWIRTGTIRDNIVIGKPDATDEEVIAAAKATHAHSFIKRLPQGYDTWITEEGGGLSQGQKQLLCITRVMLIRPPMLILDEATSSIDTRTEIRIQRAFEKLMEGRTSFIVAHRLSTIMDADRILVMKDGNIIEQGSHEELLEAGGYYKTLYHSQFAGI